MPATRIKPLHSLRFWVPLLLLLFASVAGLALYVFEVRLNNRELEVRFNRRQMLRGAQLQADIERWVQRDAPGMVQSVFAGLGTVPELKEALFLDATNSVIASTRSKFIGRLVDGGQLGLPEADRRRFETELQTARRTTRSGSYFTADGNGLVAVFPTLLPLRQGELDVRRGGLVVLSFDLEQEKAVGLRQVRTDFLFYFGIILAMTLALAGSLHFLITRRLERLQYAISDIAAGRPVEISPSSPHDEISRLVRRFNEMAVIIRNEMDQRRQVMDVSRRLNRELRAISSCNQILMRATEEKGLLDEVCRVICEEADYSMAWVGFAEHDEGETLRTMASVGSHGGRFASGITLMENERGYSPAGIAIRTGQTVCLQDLATDPRAQSWREAALQRGYRSAIGLPLKDDESRTFGALLIYSSACNAFTPDEIRLLEELAGDLAFGIVMLRTRAERKRAEQSIVLLSFALNNVREAAFLIGQDAQFHYVNSEACRALGYSEAELLRLGVADLDPGFPIDRWAEHWNELKTGKSLSFESRHRRKDGRTFPVEISANYFEYNGQGYNLALVRDISERQQAGMALHESEKKYRELIEKLQVAVVVHRADTQIVSCNPVAETLLGLSEEQLLGKNAVDPEWNFFGDGGTVLPPEEYPVNRVLTTRKPVRNQIVGVHRPGAAGDIWALVNANPVFDGNNRISQIIVTFVDITERRKAEEKLAHLAGIVESSEDAIIGKDLDERILSWNRGAERIYGYAAGEIVGRSIATLLPPEREHELDEIMEAVKRGIGIEHLETTRQRKDGQIIHVALTISPIRNVSGKIVGASTIARNITERKRWEEALRESQALYYSLVEQLPAGVFRKDAAGRYVYVNPWFCRLKGVNASAFLGKTPEESALTERAANGPNIAQIAQLTTQAMNHHRQIMETGKSIEIEEYGFGPDGSRQHLSVLKTPIFAPDGKVVGSQGIMFDITERKRAEEALRVANLYNRTLIEASLDPLVTIGADGRITDVNAATETATGRSRAELVGTDFCDYFTEPDKARAGYQQVFREGFVKDYELGLRHRDGGIVSVLYNAAVYRDEGGRVIGVFAAARDITERKRVEEALKISDRRFRMAQAIGHLGNWEYDLQTGIFWGSEEARRIYGFDPEAANFSTEEVEQCITERERVHQALVDLIERNKPYDLEFEIHPKGSSERKFISSIAEVRRDEQGMPLLVMGVIHDITARKDAEEAVRRLNEELERRVLERTADLQAKSDELRESQSALMNIVEDLNKKSVALEAANKELESFSYSVSHDLRGPLRSIDGFSRALLDDYNDLLDDEGRENLHTIRAASQKMGRLIDDMLRLSQINRSEMRWTKVDLSRMIEMVIDDLRKAEPGREVDVLIAPGCTATGDAALLRIALENILGNAWKYTSRKPRAKIEFGVTETAEGRTYFLRDDGCGFDMKFVHKLFGAFQRLHTPDEFPGTGIGLASVQRVIRRHGGRVWIEGDVGRGTTVYFTLPKHINPLS